MAQELGVSPKKYITILRPQLNGKLVDLAGLLPVALVSNYVHFKELPRQRFALTEEHYRKAFQRVEKGG